MPQANDPPGHRLWQRPATTLATGVVVVVLAAGGAPWPLHTRPSHPPTPAAPITGLSHLASAPPTHLLQLTYLPFQLPYLPHPPTCCS